MKTTVSVVVPTRNAGRTLAACLASIRNQSHSPVELIVVDNGSSDDTVAIARRYADAVIDAGPERSAQRNVGWRRAHGDVIVFIDADMVLDRFVVSDAVAVLRSDAAIDSLVIPEVAFGEGFLARCRGLEKRLYLGDDAVEAARVFRRRALVRVGGFDERLTAFEDWDLADRVVADGGRCARIQTAIRHDEGTVRLRTSFAKKRYYGRWLTPYRAAGPKRSLARWQLVRKWPLLVREPHLAVGLLVLKVTEVAGFLVGAAQYRHAER